MANDEGAFGTKLAALLKPHLDTSSERQPPREVEPPPAPPPVRLDEAELMALIFTHLDDDNPRVCDGIDFTRLEVLVERVRPVRIDDPVESGEPSEPDEPRANEPEREPGREPGRERAPRVDPDAWIGASWADDIMAIPSAWLECPELRPAQQALLQASRSRPLASVNLRHLGRELALRHLEFFVHACRSQRVTHCRVIPGKGVESRGEPVLKRAVLEWCRGPGRGHVLEWAPELDQHGEYGSVVLRLSAPRSSGTTAP